MLNNTLNEVWVWEKHTVDEYGKTVSRIIKKLDGVNVLNKEDWPN